MAVYALCLPGSDKLQICIIYTCIVPFREFRPLHIAYSISVTSNCMNYTVYNLYISTYRSTLIYMIVLLLYVYAVSTFN